MGGGAAPQLKPYHFKPGQSGNPSGYGGERAEAMRLARTFGKEAIEKLVEIMRHGKEANQIVAAVSILNRAFGTPPQSVEFTGELRKFVIQIPAELPSPEQWIQTFQPKAIEEKKS